MSAVLWVIVLLGMAPYALGEATSKKYAEHGTWGWFLLAMLFYTATCALFLVGMRKYSSLLVLGGVWNVGYAIITFLLAVAVFREPCSVLQIVGALFGFASIILLTR